MTDENGLTPQQVEEFRTVFYMFTDSDEIECDQLESVMRQLGMNASKEEIEQMIAEADEDGGGTIDLAEFMKMMAKQVHGGISDEELSRVFMVFSKGQNYITHQSLRQVLATLSQGNVSLPDDEIEAMFTEVVGSGDRISLDSFLAFVNSIIK